LAIFSLLVVNNDEFYYHIMRLITKVKKGIMLISEMYNFISKALTIKQKNGNFQKV